MNRRLQSLRALLSAAAIAALAVSCNLNDDEPQPLPQVDISEQYKAVKLHSDGIHMGVKGKWIQWLQDSATIKSYVNRVIAEENSPGFLPTRKSTNVTQTEVLSFANGIANLQVNGQNTTYNYKTVENTTLLWLRQRDTLTYYENDKPLAVSKLGLISPVYYKKVVSSDSAGFKYKVRTVPERYFAILTGELQEPGIVYHIKTKDGVEDYGIIHNYLHDNQSTILQSLEVGDTLLIQLYRKDYEY